jgi:hypothetical protein
LELSLSLESILEVLPIIQTLILSSKSLFTMPKRTTTKTSGKAGSSMVAFIPPDGPIIVEGEGSSSSHHDCGTQIQDKVIRLPDIEGLANMMEDPHQVAQLMVEMKKQLDEELACLE